MERAYIYGDSLLKATVPDAAMRYHFHLSEVMAQYPTHQQGTLAGGARRGPWYGRPLGAGGLRRQRQ